MNNYKLYKNWIKQGYKYIFNPITHEIHRLTAGNYYSSCNLYQANLEYFIPLKTIDQTIRNPKTGKVINGYRNNCSHCLPLQQSISDKLQQIGRKQLKSLLRKPR